MTETQKSKHRGRTFLVVLAGLVLLAVLAAVVVPLLIPWDKVKAAAEQKISQATHHQVTVGSLGFNIFKGVVIKDLRVANAAGFSPEPLLSDQGAVVQYRLLPLLWGQVLIKAVVLERPTVLVEKAADGTFNFSDMLPAKSAPAASPAAPSTAKAGPPAIPLELLISRLAIENASLSYHDLKSHQIYTVEAFNLEINNLTLAGLTPVKVLLSAKLKALGTDINLKVEADWRLQYAQEKFLLDRLAVSLPGVALAVAGSVGQVLTSPQLDVTGNLDVDFGVLLAALRPALTGKTPAGSGLTGSLKVGFKAAGAVKDPKALTVSLDDAVDAHWSMPGMHLPLKIAGKINLNKNDLDLRQELTLPPAQADLVRGVKAAGTVLLTGTVKALLGDPQQMAIALQVAAKNISASYEEKQLLENIQATLAITPEQISLPALSGKLGGQPVKFSLLVRGFDLRDPATLKPPALKAQATWTLESPLLDVDALLALMPGKPGAGREGAGQVDAPDAAGAPAAPGPEMQADKVVPPGLGMAGTAKLGGLKFGKVTLGKMNFKLDLKNRVCNETGAIAGYQGAIAETVRLDFTQNLLGYAVNADLKNVDVQPLLNDVVDTFVAAKLKKPQIISEIKDKLSGRLSGKLQINGAGVSPEAAKPRLTGNGAFDLKNGRISKFAFQDNLASLFGSDKFRQDIPFDNTLINFTLAQQKVDLTKFDMSSGARGEGGDIRLWAQGKIKFTADFEEFHLRPALSPRASSNLSAQFRQYAEVLKDAQGWMVIPVVMNGPIRSPQVLPDWDWIKSQFSGYAGKKVNAAAQKAGEKVQGFINSQQGKSAEEIKNNAAEEMEKAKDQLKNLNGLKDLFK
jgi:uncharacterized protein involved in outer membrane biogenesis